MTKKITIALFLFSIILTSCNNPQKPICDIPEGQYNLKKADGLLWERILVHGARCGNLLRNLGNQIFITGDTLIGTRDITESTKYLMEKTNTDNIFFVDVHNSGETDRKLEMHLTTQGKLKFLCGGDSLIFEKSN